MRKLHNVCQIGMPIVHCSWCCLQALCIALSTSRTTAALTSGAQGVLQHTLMKLHCAKLTQVRPPVLCQRWSHARTPCAVPAPQDPTNHPLWTGKDSGMSAEDGRMAKFLSKYEGFTNIGLAPAAGKKTGSSETADGVAGKGNQ